MFVFIPHHDSLQSFHLVLLGFVSFYFFLYRLCYLWKRTIKKQLFFSPQSYDKPRCPHGSVTNQTKSSESSLTCPCVSARTCPRRSGQMSSCSFSSVWLRLAVSPALHPPPSLPCSDGSPCKKKCDQVKPCDLHRRNLMSDSVTSKGS